MIPSTQPIDPKLLNCWNEIGISGDRSCPKLVEFIHCRNCPVFGRAAEIFFERQAPEGYLKEWSDELASPVVQVGAEMSSLLVFRLGGEWYGVSTMIVVEVTNARPLHTIPHRKAAILQGMVNLRGQLQLQVSLKELLGVREGNRSPTEPATRGDHLVILKKGSDLWVFAADEVVGVRRFLKKEAKAVPSTKANSTQRFSRAVFLAENRTIGYLDDDRLFEALREIQG